MSDEIVCVERDCGKTFNLTAGFKRLMEERPEVLPPKRCWNCRQKRKNSQDKQTAYENE